MAPFLALKRLTLVQKLDLVLLLIIFASYPGQNQFQSLILNPGAPKVLSADISLPTTKIPTISDKDLPRLTAQAFIVYEPNSGTILYQKNADTKLDPASTTKIMTALVALDTYALDDVITIKTAQSSIGSSMHLKAGDQLTAKDLLYGLLIDSANDAAVAFAENYCTPRSPSGEVGPCGYKAFVEAMNAKAAALHLTNTHFANVSGIEGALHKTTVLDLAILTREAMENDLFAEIVKTRSALIQDVTGLHTYELTSTNELLGQVPGILGVKTGWTENAGECLVTMVERDGHRIITVVLGSEDRFGESKKLIDWTFANVQW